MRLSKYFGTNEDQHDGTLVWPGRPDGYPLRFKGQERPLLPQSELEDVPVVFDAKVRIFDLSKQQDLDDYRDILDRHFNGWYQITKNTEVYDESIHSWRVRLEWVQIYGEVAAAK